MSRFETKKVETTLEKQIVTRMIVSTTFLNKVIGFMQSAYFSAAHLQEITDWVLEYHEKYEVAPAGDIQGIFEAHESQMEEAEAHLYRVLLQGLSEYSDTIDDNHDYLVDKTISFCSKRELEITIGNSKVYLEEGNVPEAELELLSYKRMVAATSSSIDVFTKEAVLEAFAEEQAGLFRLSGALGEYMGEMHRGWLVSIAGAYKRGKTWWLIEMYIRAMQLNLNVMFFSLEMTQKDILKRMVSRLTGRPQESGEIRIPVIDCIHNQKGTCLKPQRVQLFDLTGFDGTPAPEDVPDYRACSVCRTEPDATGLPFVGAIWYETIQRNAITKDVAVSAMEKAVLFSTGTHKLKTYPRFSANISDMQQELDILASTEDFIPDVIIVDYADILKPEKDGQTGYQKEDATWIALSQLAGERHALVITATQVTKDGQNVRSIKVDHTARWSGKSGHVDAMYGINQEPVEKDMGMQRIGTLLHRHRHFSEIRECTVLQNFEIGATHLDSFLTTEQGSTNDEEI